MKFEAIELGEICDFLYGGSLPEAKRQDGKITVYGSNGSVGWHNQAITSGPSIIVGRKGSIGKVHFSHQPCYPIDTTYYIEKTKKSSDLTWLYYLLLSLNLSDLNKSAAVPGLNRDDAYAKRVLFPPLEEQQRIARIASKCDRIRRTRRYTQQLSDTYLQSVFLEMFGDPARNPKGWDIKPLGDFLSFITSGGRGWAEYYSSSGARFIRSLDVQMNHISDSEVVYVQPPAGAEAERTKVKENDVLLTITGSRIGRVAPVPKVLEDAHISQHVAILRLRGDINPFYLSIFLSQKQGGQEQITKMQYGQTKPGLNFDQIKKFKIPVPPLSSQEKFIQIVQKYDRIRTQQREAARQAEHLFQTTLHRAFSGEL
jgi:type I restriction enzyme, S subunit